jgi:Ca2+-binding RTX toxin-like protein
MSTTPWTDPNNPENEYDIGTIGMEPIKPDGIFGETIDAIRKYMLPFNLAYHAISAIITGGESLCPTYGLWAGAGWSGGARTSQVKWTESPCYNEIVKESSNPQDCYSLVDAIAKTHDWRYDQAEKDFPNDELNQTKAKLAADVLMLQDIMNALMYGGSYYSITGNYMGNDTWEPKLYTNTLDGTEKIFLIGLAPLFYAKIKCTEMGMEGPDNYSDQAGEMVHNILSRLPITGVFLDPFDPSKKTIYSDAYHLLIMQTDSESRCDAMIMDLNASADSKPLIVGIDYETGFTKPTDTFLINGEGVIRINGGTGNDEIKIVGEENVDNSIYKFEIVGGDGNDKIEGSDGNDTIYGGIGNDTLKGGKGNDTLYGGDGNDTYYVEADGSIDKIEDKQGINTVFISGKKITDFYWDADSSRYKSPDDEVVGVMSGTDFIVTYNGTQVILNEDFQFGDFGIDLRTPTANLTEILPPETANPIVGDYEPIDFDPDPDVTEYHYDTWGNVMVDTSKPAPGRGDTLYDTAATDKIEGKDGNDFINVSNGGNDLILGQAGNDHITVYGGSGNNILEGGDGDDYIMLYGGNNNNLIRGGVGQDNIFAGNTGENRIYGGDGNDVIDGESSAICVIEGEAGSDIIFGSVNGNNQLFGDSRSGKDMATLIADGDVALDSGVKGDIVVAGPGDNNYLYGSNGYDIMWGGYGKDLLVAGGGNDLIIGDGGNIHANWGENNWSFHIDYVDGEYTPDIDGLPDWDMNATVESDDVIYAGTGNDYVDAGGGDDEVYGGAGSDTVFGDAGHDFIEGGDGDDILAGDNGTLLAPELNGNDYIDGGAGNDAIQGDGGNDDLFGGADNDTIIGGEGDDYLDGEDGADILYGGNGKDDLFGGSENDTLYGNDGDDYLDGEAGADNLYGGIGNDVMFGDADNDTLYGMDGDDYLDGEAGLNYLYGGGGNDTIFGGDENDRLEGDHMDSTQGNDYLDGLGGDDILIGAGGADTLFGGEGNDQLHGDGAGIADGNDYLDGEGGDDAIQGYAGNDTLYGGDGNDSIWGGSENDTIYGDAGDDQLLGEYGNDYLDGGVGIDYLDGGYGDDTIYGGADDDTLIGGNGSDVYIFGMGDGSDLIWNTRTEGTIDTVKLGVNIDDVTITQNGNLIISINGTTDKLTIVNWYWDYAANVVEQFQFADDTVLTWLEIEGRIANTIYGTSGNDIIYGENSSDTIYGYEGNDVIYGGGGSNLLDGGAGNDELISNSGVNDTLIGGLGNDTMSGSGYQPVTMMGGSNDDTYRVKNNGDIVIENDYEYNGGLDLVYSDLAAYTLTANVENLNLDLNGQNGAGNDLNNVINGNANANLLAGSGGNDTLTGLDGNDTLDGGSGNDSLQGETGNDTYLFGIGSGADIVYDYDATVGNTDIIVLNNDILPTQVILNRSANDLIISIVGTTDTMTVSGWFSESAYRVEQIQFADSTIWDAPYIEQNAVPTGTEGKDVLNGTSGNDLLLGRGGNDTLYGYAGNDTLDGGSGVDKMFGGSGDDTYIIDHVRDAVTENANDGMDTVITSINYALGPNVVPGRDKLSQKWSLRSEPL